MCETCGCGQPEDAVKMTLAGEHDTHEGHHHHHHDHHHTHEHSTRTVVDVQSDIMQKNNLLAERNRGYFLAKNIYSYNLMSSPGSGKTTLLEETIKILGVKAPIYVIEGDQQTMNDANRIEAAGAKALQVNTGKGCHLDAHMVLHAIEKLQPENEALLFIENVGNLVCPAMFDLGEKERVVMLSVTEGDDKPLKYPNAFEDTAICIINKIDLLPYVQFDVEKVKDYARRINPEIQFFETSATSGQGLEAWCNYLLHNFKPSTANV